MRAPHPRALGFLSARAREAHVPGGSDQRAVHSFGRPAPRETRSRRATRECLLALAAVDAMLEDGTASRDAIAGERTALLYTTAACYAASNRSFIEGGGGIHFAYTAPAVVPAEVAIEFGVTGPYAIFLGGPPATLRAIWQAALLLESGACDRALVLAVEIFEECEDLFGRAPRLVGRPLVEAAACLWLEPGQGRLVFESSRADGPRSRATRPDGEEMLGCGPLAALDRWRRDGRKAPLELCGAWRGEQARLTWDQDPMSNAADAPVRGEPVSELHGRCGR
jgi:Beta-ketoacyl synthase, N-terminal domain